MIRRKNIIVCVILSIVTCGIYGLYWFICLTNDTNTAAGEPGTSGGMAVLLTLITCGIYGMYWAYKSGDKIDIAKQKRGIPSGNNGVLYLILFLLTGGLITYILLQNELNKLAA